MASLSSAKSSWRRSRGEVDGAYGPRTRWALSRRELREEGRRGVVGRERGDLERVRRRAEGGSAVGVDDAIGFVCLMWYSGCFVFGVYTSTRSVALVWSFGGVL